MRLGRDRNFGIFAPETGNVPLYLNRRSVRGGTEGFVSSERAYRLLTSGNREKTVNARRSARCATRLRVWDDRLSNILRAERFISRRRRHRRRRRRRRAAAPRRKERNSDRFGIFLQLKYFSLGRSLLGVYDVFNFDRVSNCLISSSFSRATIRIHRCYH